jgi:adenosyl cobinamide kinase/adenosyl cobinamide phosphate guanylyltransferase
VSLVVLLGGARAGKSALAQELAARWEGPVAYVATAEARDEEMAERIERHRRERPEGWTTVEEPLQLRAVLERLEQGQAAVVDCLTLWVSNALERGDSPTAVLAEAGEAAALAAAHPAPVIVVSNEVGLGIVPASPLARVYRDLLGAVNRAFVDEAEAASLVVAGRMLRLEQPA